MELRQLKYFVAVAEEGSFTSAAAEVHVAQPGVSAQIRRLERELGQDLLDRSGRTVRLTEVGAAVIPYARAALAAAAGAKLAVDELSGLLRGHVAMGMVTLSSFTELPDLLAAFNHQHPAVEVTLTEANSDRLLDAIHTGEIDLALIGLSSTPPAGIATQVVTDQPLVAAVSHRDPLAQRETITLRALGHRKLISLPVGTGMRTCLDDACTAAGLRPHIAFEASDPVTLAQLASRGLGVAILPKAFAETQPIPLHAIRIIQPPLRSRLELAWRADGPISPAARALITHARKALAAPPPSDTRRLSHTGNATTIAARTRRLG
jgi:DNA-binding transcriptional LysR family regulator